MKSTIELDTRAQSICTKIGANGETVTISVNTEESHQSTLSGIHIFKNIVQRSNHMTRITQTKR